MRAALLLGGIVGVVVTALPAVGQTLADVRVVNTAEVLVRSGPSDKFYPTSKLHKGDKVEIVSQPAEAQQPGWLAIKPPRGSFSWINQRFVEVMVPGTGKVVADNAVAVLVGSSETNEQPTKEAIKAARGSQVIILDRPNYTDSGVWLPIRPQAGEVRYIPASAVLPSGAAQAVAANYGSGPKAQPSPPGTPVVAPAAGQEEERSTLQKAADLTTDPVRRQQILQLIASLPAPGPAPQLPGHPSNVASPVNASVPSGGTPVQASTASNTHASSQAPGVTASGARWSSYGELRRTAFKEADGRPVYALVDSQGRAPLYATPLPNLSLEPYVGRRLTLYGPMSYHGDPCLRVDMMTVSHVYLVPGQTQY
jgi:hypothetical protein